MGSIIGFFTTAINYVVYSIVRGIVSLLTMGAAMHVWTRVNRCRGVQPARPATILYFPVVATAVMVVFFAADSVRFLMNLSAGLVAELFVVTVVCVPAGLLAGLFAGSRVPMVLTRWGRVMMKPSGNHLVAWFATMILAIFFLILPFGWLAVPTSGLLLFGTLQLVAAQLVLYARYKRLQARAARTAFGGGAAAIDLSLDARETAVVACALDLWAAAKGAPVPVSNFAAALAQGGRARTDAAFAAAPAVDAAWRDLAGNAEALNATLRSLVAKGVMKDGFAPGEALARLLAAGSFARTVTLAHARFSPDGKAVARQGHAVVAQGGGTNLLFTGGAGGGFAAREVKAPEILGLLARLWLVR